MFTSRQESLRKAKDAVETLRQDRSPLIEDILSRVIIDCLKKYQQKVNVGIQDSVSDLLETFKLKVSAEIFDIAQGWTLSSKREKILFPSGCRFLYTMGQSTFVVIEEKPGIRSLKFMATLLEEEEKRRLPRPRDGSYLFSLSFPYVIFLLQFKGVESDSGRQEGLANLYVGWSQTPLHKLDTMLYRPFLPNQHGNMSVCTGVERNFSSQNISQITESVISHYWNSTFNSDLSDMWWKKGSRDKLRTASTWQEESKTDPLFILQESLEKGQTLEKLVEDCIGTVENGEPEISSLRHRLVEAIDDGSQDLFDRILKYFRKTRLDRHYPKDITGNLITSLSENDQQLSALAGVIERELVRFEEDIIRSQKDVAHYGWVKKGVFWL